LSEDRNVGLPEL